MCLQRQLEGDRPDQHPSTHIQNNPYITLLSLKNELHTLVSIRPTSHEWQTEVYNLYCLQQLKLLKRCNTTLVDNLCIIMEL